MTRRKLTRPVTFSWHSRQSTSAARDSKRRSPRRPWTWWTSRRSGTRASVRTTFLPQQRQIAPSRSITDVRNAFSSMTVRRFSAPVCSSRDLPFGHARGTARISASVGRSERLIRRSGCQNCSWCGCRRRCRSPANDHLGPRDRPTMPSTDIARRCYRHVRSTSAGLRVERRCTPVDQDSFDAARRRRLSRSCWDPSCCLRFVGQRDEHTVLSRCPAHQPLHVVRKLLRVPRRAATLWHFALDPRVVEHAETEVDQRVVEPFVLVGVVAQLLSKERQCDAPQPAVLIEAPLVPMHLDRDVDIFPGERSEERLPRVPFVVGQRQLTVRRHLAVENGNLRHRYPH